MIKYLGSVLCVLILISCEKTIPRKPIGQSKELHIKASVKRNQKINQLQQEAIKKVIANDKNRQYITSAVGYSYALKRTSPSTVYPQRGDEVKFVYKIETLTGETLYDEMELGEVNYLVDKEDLLPALRYAVKDLKVGEIGVFLVPSFLGYGYQGDGNKVGINQPLRFTIQLNELKQNNPND